MKNIFLTRALSIVLLFSAIHAMAMESGSDDEAAASKPAPAAPITLSKDERDTQKMILMLAGTSALLAGSHFLADRFHLPDVGNFFNLSRGEFRAACGLSSLFAGIGLIANDKWRPTLRSAAWRFPLMAMVGGLMSHPKVNQGLTLAPLGLGAWFKENPPMGKSGTSAIYAIGTWYALKPSLDRVENAVSALFQKK